MLYTCTQKKIDQIKRKTSCVSKSIGNSTLFILSMALYRARRLCLCASLNHSSQLLISINLIWNCRMTERIDEVVLTV